MAAAAAVAVLFLAFGGYAVYDQFIKEDSGVAACKAMRNGKQADGSAKDSCSALLAGSRPAFMLSGGECAHVRAVRSFWPFRPCGWEQIGRRPAKWSPQPKCSPTPGYAEASD